MGGRAGGAVFPQPETPRRPRDVRIDVVSGLGRLYATFAAQLKVVDLGAPPKSRSSAIGNRSVETTQTRNETVCRSRGRRGVSSKGTSIGAPPAFQTSLQGQKGPFLGPRPPPSRLHNPPEPLEQQPRIVDVVRGHHGRVVLGHDSHHLRPGGVL